MFINRPNIAILISAIAVLISFLNYLNSPGNPILSAKGKAWQILAQTPSDEDSFIRYSVHLDILNSGKRRASNVRITLVPFSEENPFIDVLPPTPFKKDVKSSNLFLEIPGIPPKQHLFVHVVDRRWRKDKRGERRVVGDFPYFLNVVCDEGSSLTQLVELESKKSHSEFRWLTFE